VVVSNADRPAKDRSRDAHHEAAHVVAIYLLLGIVPRRVCLTRVRACVSKDAGNRKERILVSLVGIEAENRYLRAHGPRSMTLDEAYAAHRICFCPRKDFEMLDQLLEPDEKLRPCFDEAEQFVETQWTEIGALAQVLEEKGCLGKRFLASWLQKR
jgi:hypothetical protein